MSARHEVTLGNRDEVVVAHQWPGGKYQLDSLSRAWTVSRVRTHVARSISATHAICGVKVACASRGGTIPAKEMCVNCARVWVARMDAVEADPWEQF